MKRPFLPRSFRRFLAATGLLAAPWLGAITPAELSASLARGENILVVDVRSAIAYAGGHIPGALNIPLALLPHKRLPAVSSVVVYTDGLGVVSDREALAAARARPGVNADVLAGGYVAWVSATRVSTAAAGVSREKLPGLTYQQLVAADKEDIVLLDLRAPAAAVAAASAVPVAIDGRRVAAASAPDSLAAFAAKLGVPVVAPENTAELAAPGGNEGKIRKPSGVTRAAMQIEGAGRDSRLFVLVADNEAAANEAARELRAGGYHRFTILIGGMEIIRHEGRLGSGRLEGGASAAQK